MELVFKVRHNENKPELLPVTPSHLKMNSIAMSKAKRTHANQNHIVKMCIGHEH